MHLSHHFTKRDIEKCLSNLPLGLGDIVYCHSAIGYFGRMDKAKTSIDMCETFFDSIFEIIGQSGTLIVPTYTYSFAEGNVFDVEQSVSNMGLFSEWIRCHPDSIRSVDPNYSVSVIGKHAKRLIKNIPVNSFTSDSVFGRFYKAEGKVLCLTFPGCTFIHYVERALQVPYRFDKTFEGFILKNKVRRKARSTIYVCYNSDDALEHTPISFEDLARQQRLQHVQKLGRGEVSLISSSNVFDLIKETLPSRPWFLTMAERLDIDNPCIIAEPAQAN